MDIEKLLQDITNHIANDPTLPLGSKPIIQIGKSAKLLIIGQAPGIRAHNSDLPWNDASGNRLRSWLDINRETFYDKNKVALMPMGFCYPGVDKYGGDKPPYIEHAKLWHQPLISLMPDIKLTLLVGSYAQNYYLKPDKNLTMTEIVRAWKNYLPKYIVLPHPSWRNNGWIKKNIWFEEELVPELRKRVREILTASDRK